MGRDKVYEEKGTAKEGMEEEKADCEGSDKWSCGGQTANRSIVSLVRSWSQNSVDVRLRLLLPDEEG